MTEKSEAPWVEGKTIGQVLHTTAKQYGDRDAMVFPQLDLRLSWSELAEKTEEVVRGLLSLGIQRGDAIAVWATNVPQWVLLQFATARIGAVLVTINPSYRPHELKHVLRQSDAIALFMVDHFKKSNYFEMIDEVCPELAAKGSKVLRAKEFPKLRHVVSMTEDAPAGAMTWQGLIDAGIYVDHGWSDKIDNELSPDNAINIQYTSGTTGFPKGAMLSHRNLLLNAYYVGKCQRFTEEDRICIPVPFYHCFGCVMGTLCAAVYGAAMIVPAPHFQAEPTLDALEKEKGTAIYGVPTMFITMLDHPSLPQRDLASVRTGIMAGSPCPIETMRQVIDRIGAHEITIAYGQTEASPVVTMTRADDPIERRVETVGCPLPGVEVKIVDPETGDRLGEGEQGELCCRGHGVMLGYYGDEEATRGAIDQDHWLHSGDLALQLSDEYFKITGRIKDMVIRGGENIYPREIEEFLFTHPAISQAAVVGLPDAKYGEELCAWIILAEGKSLTDDEVRDFCRASLAHYKTPRYVCFVDEFPQTVTGKIQKFKIRDQMIAELGLEEAETA